MQIQAAKYGLCDYVNKGCIVNKINKYSTNIKMGRATVSILTAGNGAYCANANMLQHISKSMRIRLFLTVVKEITGVKGQIRRSSDSCLSETQRSRLIQRLFAAQVLRLMWRPVVNRAS